MQNKQPAHRKKKKERNTKKEEGGRRIIREYVSGKHWVRAMKNEKLAQ